jgi:amino acid adenylation domain-containing protein
MADLHSRIAALSPEQRKLLESRVADLVAARGPAQRERIKPRDRARPTPLGIAQQREWAIERLRSANNISGAFRVEGELDLELLSRVFTEVTERHEVLRSTVAQQGDGTPVQVVHPVTPVPVPVADLSHLAPDQQREEVQRRCKAEILRPFDQKDPQRLRITLMRLAADIHVALFITDHAASDAWSLSIVVQELVALYDIHRNGGRSLPPPEIQFGDFAAWQREQFSGPRIAAELQHWRQTLAGIPAGLALPTDRPYPARPTYAGDVHDVNLSPEFAADLRRFSERENASLFVILLAACSVLLYRYLDQEDLVIGSLVAGRKRVQTERLIGCFANPLPLRMRLTDDQTLREVVHEARHTMATALDHQDLPFDRLIEELGLGRESSQTSLSRVWINVLTVPDNTIELPGLRITPEPIDLGLASVDLTLSAIPRADTLQLQWQYMTELFDADAVVLLADQFQKVLRQVVTAPGTAVRQVELAVAPASTRQAPAAAPGGVDAGFVELFQRRVALAPYAPAVICDGVPTSYADLNRDANRLARHLRARGVGRDTRVGILVDRSPQLAVAILGVLKAGGAYVPLDPGYPPDRIAFMLADASAQVLVAQQRLAPLLAGAGSGLPDQTVLLDGPSPLAGGGADHDLPEAPDPTSLAYVVYTSGSTGQPKGAMIEHRSLVTFARDVVDRLGLGTGDRFLQFASPSFDVLVEELFPIWLAGGAVVVTTQHLISGEADLTELVERERLTVMELPTAYWHEWVRELDRLGRELASSLRLVIIGGERVLPERLALWRRLGVPLMHVYGLTETTVSSTFFRLDPADPVRDWPNLPIGTPLPSADLRILDSRLRPVPVAGTGELYIGGDSLARGYLSRPGLTAHRFIADPDPARPGQRLYRTGDVVRQRADGNLEFISRADTQIKIRGFRVEPMEIESALSRHPQVAESVVTLHEPAPGDRRLVAYVVPRPGAAPGLGELRRFTERELPAYMVPSAFVELGALPLTANGKVDRDRLPAPDGDRPELAEEYVAPQSPLQQKLADIVATVVAVAKVGIHDNFFDLGGDSIQAIQVVARAQEEGIGLSPLDFFEHPTVALLAQAVTSTNTDRAVSRRPPDADPVLSFDQERLWLENQLRPKTAYHVGGRVRLVGPLNVAALGASVRAILARHEALRTRFPTVDGRPVQVVDDVEENWRLSVKDLTDVDGDRADVARRLMDEQFTTPFDLAEGPLFRCLLIRLSDTEHHLSVTAHHIVSDVWSVGLFGQELSALYQAGGDVDRAGLPALPIQYRDYAVWQRGWLAGEVLETHVGYWRRHLAGAAPALTLPTAQRSPGAGGDRVVSSLSKEETAALHDLCRKHGVTSFMAMLASLATVLGRCSGQRDVVIGVSMSDRTDTGTEPLIGFFINTLPLRVDLSGNPTFADLLRRVRQISLDGYAHAEAPVDVLVRELQVPRDPRRTPLFQVILNVIDVSPIDHFGDISLEVLEPPQLLSSFDLILTAQQLQGETILRLEFNAELYQAAMMQTLVEHLRTFVRAVVDDPTRGLLDYPLQAAGEAARAEIPAGDRPAPAPHLAVDWHAQRPHRVAVIDRDGEWSYQWLSQAADRVAQVLAQRSVPDADHLGVIRRPTAAFVAAVLGCMKAGATFSVIEAAAPVPARYPGVLTVLDVSPASDVAEGTLDLSTLFGNHADAVQTVREVAPGSRGPVCDWAVERFQFGGDDRFTVLSPRPGHLLSALSSAFCAGAALVLPERSLAGDIAALITWLQANAISVIYVNPPIIRAIAAQAPRPYLPALRYVFVDNSGELISHDINALRKLSATCRCVGVYRVGQDGRPLAMYAVPDDFQPQTAPLRVPLGTDLADNPAQLRHSGGQPAAIGEVAEICFGSYRTGDLGRRWPDGTLEFVGKLG